jgi:pimeloyl-ACP methyl ester carboxylesterase
MGTSHSDTWLRSTAAHSSKLQDCGSLDVNGHQLYWERYGDTQAPPVLLLHHGLGSARAWRRQIPAFVGAGWQVLACDRWGYGRSDERPRFQHAYLAMDAAEAFQVLGYLGIERLALVGHSDGGSIALLMAAEQPARITALVVVAAHIYFEPMMADGLDLIAQSALDPVLLQGLKREHGERAPTLIQAWTEHWRSAEAQSLNMNDRLPAIACPTLVVQGELDEHASAQHAIDISAGVKDSQLWLIPNVKHMPPHEIPEKFNQRILEFLAESGA